MKEMRTECMEKGQGASMFAPGTTLPAPPHVHQPEAPFGLFMENSLHKHD